MTQTTNPASSDDLRKIAQDIRAIAPTVGDAVYANRDAESLEALADELITGSVDGMVLDGLLDDYSQAIANYYSDGSQKIDEETLDKRQRETTRAIRELFKISELRAAQMEKPDEELERLMDEYRHEVEQHAWTRGKESHDWHDYAKETRKQIRALFASRSPVAATTDELQQQTTEETMRGSGFHESTDNVLGVVESLWNAITFYGPHTCDRCGWMIAKVAKEQGGAEFDYPGEGPYPNTKWKLHECNGLAPRDDTCGLMPNEPAEEKK
jgi:hypothetical protein